MRSLLKKYNPLSDGVYMSKSMRQYFQELLNRQLESIKQKEAEISLHIAKDHEKEADIIDQGTSESILLTDCVYHAHEDNLRQRIQEALKRIQRGTYGYCAETGEPIGVRRLLAAPQANFCVDVQERKEKEQQKFNKLAYKNNYVLS